MQSTATAIADLDAPPPFVRLASHPVWWRLLRELVESDRAVRELTTLVDEPQNLASYHLRLLREGGLVTSRRSSADGRDSYYAIDLVACRNALQSTGSALHPAIGILRAGGFLFFAFAGYARIATLGEEVRDPATVIAKAIPRALAGVLVLYAVVGVTLIAAVPVDAVSASAAPLLDHQRRVPDPSSRTAPLAALARHPRLRGLPDPRRAAPLATVIAGAAVLVVGVLIRSATAGHLPSSE